MWPNKYEERWKRGDAWIQVYARELMEKGIFPANFDYFSHKEIEWVIKYKENLPYRIYRNIITIPRQGIVRGCGIFLLLELLVMLGAFIIEVYPSELWWVVNMVFKIAEYLCLGVVLGFIFFILYILDVFGRLLRWFNELMDAFVDEGIPALLNIFQWVMFGWLVKILFETLL